MLMTTPGSASGVGCIGRLSSPRHQHSAPDYRTERSYSVAGSRSTSTGQCACDTQYSLTELEQQAGDEAVAPAADDQQLGRRRRSRPGSGRPDPRSRPCAGRGRDSRPAPGSTISLAAPAASAAGLKVSGNPPATAAAAGIDQVITASTPKPVNLAWRTAQARAEADEGDPSTPTTMRPSPLGAFAESVAPSCVVVIGLLSRLATSLRIARYLIARTASGRPRRAQSLCKNAVTATASRSIAASSVGRSGSSGSRVTAPPS